MFRTFLIAVFYVCCVVLGVAAYSVIERGQRDFPLPIHSYHSP